MPRGQLGDVSPTEFEETFYAERRPSKEMGKKSGVSIKPSAVHSASSGRLKIKVKNWIRRMRRRIEQIFSHFIHSHSCRRSLTMFLKFFAERVFQRRSVFLVPLHPFIVRPACLHKTVGGQKLRKNRTILLLRFLTLRASMRVVRVEPTSAPRRLYIPSPKQSPNRLAKHKGHSCRQAKTGRPYSSSP